MAKLYGIIGGYETGNIDNYIENVSKKVLSALEGGMSLLQLREKNMPVNDEIKLAKNLKKLCKSYNVPLIINDSIEICIKAGVDGVHLGQADCSIKEARKLLGSSKIIGGTAHNLAEALQAEKDGADYIGSGAAFGSKTKADASRIELNEYNIITKSVSIPVFAIGGIMLENMDILDCRGLSGIAVISAVFEGEDVKNNVIKLNEKLKTWEGKTNE